MDKAEYRIATDHIKKLISQGEYAEASHIADTIDWRRVKSVMMLCTISDLYKINRRYEDAKELLYMAYERNPESRTILYSLCDLSIKLEEFVAAIEYYKSFVEVAPRDTGRYVLQYRLYQAQDVSLEERIEVLEQLKNEEYVEKWAYELAYLYHRIGFATKCVEECDELILWFGKGRYVYKAMELKMLHEPLTPSQQRLYDNRFEHLEQAKDMTRVLPRIDSGDSEMTDESMVDVTDAPTIEIPKEYIEKEIDRQPEEIQVKTLDVANVYNTMNLQKELADSLKEILDGSKQQEVHMESASENVIDQTRVINDEPVLVPAEEEPIKVTEEIVIKEIITEGVVIDKQITGQISIEDILAGLEPWKPEETVSEQEPIAEESVLAEPETEAAEEPAAEIIPEEIMEEPAEESIAELAPEEIIAEPAEESTAELAPEEIVEEPEEAEKVEEPAEQSVNNLLEEYETFIRCGETEAQIAKALEQVSMEPVKNHVAITGHDLSICFEFIKVYMSDLKRKGIITKNKTAKISAVNLNKKEPSEIISKCENSILIIERAGRLNKEAVAKIEACLKEKVESILVFLTDTAQGMDRFAERYSSLASMFDLRIDIKDYSGEELIDYAVKYAYECEYAIETMGALALRRRIEEMISNDIAPTMEDAKNIIDEAIEHANRKNLKHFIDVLLRRRFDEEDMIVLQEEDFD